MNKIRSDKDRSIIAMFPLLIKKNVAAKKL
jgi:hypothetical protein